MKRETVVVIVGAGPAGLATSACLNLFSIPNIILEREDCNGSLWKKKTYDRLKLHLPKHLCQLPHMPFPPNEPTFVSKNGFIQYLDSYSSTFGVCPMHNRMVEDAWFEKDGGRWHVVAKNVTTCDVEEYVGIYLVVASGENNEGFIPNFTGLDEFKGKVIHSSEYESGKCFIGKDVLVVGYGNSGVEIAYDLSNWNVRTSIVVRGPIHVLTKEMVQFGMYLLKYLPCNLVDNIMVVLSKLKYGDVTEYGLERPTKGPFFLKKITGRSPIIDVGTIEKIKDGSIQVLPSINKINEESVEFVNGKINRFDAIVFATGYRSRVKKWLKDDGNLFNDDGMPKQRNPNHWKGENGLYCAGFSQSGLFGISNDAQNIADDIKKALGT
ncbi:hypothetical protein LguiA_018278 [Lonicera macranthoides]